MSTGSKSHLPSWIFLFLVCFPQFLFGHLTSRYFFLCLAPWRWWFILKFWVAIVLAFPCITCLSDWGSKPSPVRKPLDTGLCLRPQARWENWTNFCPEVPGCTAFPLSASSFWNDGPAALCLPGRSCSWRWWKHTQLEAAGMLRPSSIELSNITCGGPLVPDTSFWLGGSLWPQAFPGQLSELTSELG